jgi:hypothetical protein
MTDKDFTLYPEALGLKEIGFDEPWSWRKKGKKVKSGLNKNIGVDPRMIRDVPPPPEDRIIKEGKTPKPPKKK